jgi:type II secretory pathway component PulF
LFLISFLVLIVVPVMSRGTIFGIRFPRWFPMTPRLAQHKSDVLCGLADAIDHGWPMGRALAVGHMISIRKQERRSLQHAMELIEQGQSPAEAIRNAGWIDATEAAWMDGASPQRTAELLRTIADQTIRDSHAKMRWLMSLLFPLLVILIAAAVLTYAYGFFSTLFRLIEGLA